MGRGRKKGAGDKPVKKKAVNVKRVERLHAGKIVGVYRIMESLIEANHSHLIDAKICICWRFGWKPDVDGRVQTHAVKKGSDADRELYEGEWDFVLYLNHEIYNGGTGYSGAVFDDSQMEADIDAALCRCAVAQDSGGSQKVDERDRPCWRLRRPDIVAFSDVLARHGLYTSDLEKIANFNLESKKRPLFRAVDHGDDDAAKKTAEFNKAQMAKAASDPPAGVPMDQAKRGRGRPKKSEQPVAMAGGA